MKPIKPIKPVKALKNAHTANTKHGMGNYTGGATRNPIGKTISSYMSPASSMKKSGKPPKKLG